MLELKLKLKPVLIIAAILIYQEAFYNGPWGKMNARDRGHLMNKYVLSKTLDTYLPKP